MQVRSSPRFEGLLSTTAASTHYHLHYPTMRTALLITLSATAAHAFVPSFGVARQHSVFTRLSAATTTITKEALIGKEFQLEEREQQDTELTELWIQEDGTIKFGQTDGPPAETSWGIWTLRDNGAQPFRMEVIRTYKTAEDRTGAHQVGPFEYEVRREYWGEIKQIGDIVTVEGTIHGKETSTNVDCEVGYFSLIDEEAAENA